MKKKNLILIGAIVILFSTSIIAQRPSSNPMMKERIAEFMQLSPEQVATLQTKRMAFYLDLSDNQQKHVKVIYLDVAKLRQEKMQQLMKEGKKPDVKTRYEIQVTRVEKLIEVKEKLKKVLSKEQLGKWVEMQAKFTPEFGKPEFQH